MTNERKIKKTTGELGEETTEATDEMEFAEPAQPDEKGHGFCPDPRVIQNFVKVGNAMRVWPS